MSEPPPSTPCRQSRWTPFLQRLLLLTAVIACLVASSVGTACADEEQATFQRFPVELLVSEPRIADIAAGNDGSVWLIEASENGSLLDDTRSRIERIGPSGSLLGEFSIPTGHRPGVPEVSFPTALAAGIGEEMWFTDAGRDSNGRSLVGRIFPTGRVLESPIPNSTTTPDGLALDPNGNVWFTDPGSGTIGIMNPAGTMVNEFPVLHQRPTAIARSVAGEMWFIDGDYVGKADEAGNVTEYPIPTNKTFPFNTTYYPRGIAAGPDGDMWLITSGYYEGYVPVGSVIVRVSPSGETTAEYPEHFNFAGFHDITAGPDGDMWFGGVPHAGLGRIDMEGHVTEFAPPAGEVDAVGVAAAPNGDIWMAPAYSEDELGTGHGFFVWRFITPLMPVNESPPMLTGAASLGATLTSTAGLWLHKPATVGYQWQTCDRTGDSCQNIAGATDATRVVSNDDIGHTLRTAVTVSGPGGSASSTSLPSGMVLAPSSPETSAMPTPAMTLAPPALLSLASVTAAWRFDGSHRYTVVRSLVIRGLPTGSVIQVGCLGTGCSFARKQFDPSLVIPCRVGLCRHPSELSAVNLVPWFAGRHLGPRAQIAVGVYKPGYVKRVFHFTMRKRHSPLVQFSCASPLLIGLAGTC